MEGRGNCVVRRAVCTVCNLERIECDGEAVLLITNALLAACPASSINKLQIVQNAVARVLTRSRKYDHITPNFTVSATGYY